MPSEDECAAGWIIFATPEGITPDRAIFTGPDDSERFSLP
jgi:hypothetical protein